MGEAGGLGGDIIPSMLIENDGEHVNPEIEKRYGVDGCLVFNHLMHTVTLMSEASQQVANIGLALSILAVDHPAVAGEDSSSLFSTVSDGAKKVVADFHSGFVERTFGEGVKVVITYRCGEDENGLPRGAELCIGELDNPTETKQYDMSDYFGTDVPLW